MEDYLITTQVNFINTQTGEVIFNSQFSKPLSVLVQSDDNFMKYFRSFIRGVRQCKHCALTITVANDRETPKVVEQSIVF